jgi:ABC-2 type transport system permease protein
MNASWTIAKREFSSQFYSPIAYVVLSVFALVSTGFFFTTFAPGQPLTIRNELGYLVWLMVFLLPAISMRLISEELRSGTIETLMTAPLSDAQVIAGKWLGAMLFFLTLLAPVAVHIAVMEFNGDPDYGPIATGLLGLIFVGGLYLAIGLFVSAFSSNQIVTWIVTVLITGSLTIGLYMLAQVQMPAFLTATCMYLNVDAQYQDFAKGLVDLTNFIYFVSGIGLFLFLAVLALQSRRWR